MKYVLDMMEKVRIFQFNRNKTSYFPPGKILIPKCSIEPKLNMTSVTVNFFQMYQEWDLAVYFPARFLTEFSSSAFLRHGFYRNKFSEVLSHPIKIGLFTPVQTGFAGYNDSRSHISVLYIFFLSCNI